MSQFHKLLLTVAGASMALYFLTCSSFSVFTKHPQSINEKEVINTVFNELNYELTYGDKNIDQEAFIKKAIQESLKK